MKKTLILGVPSGFNEPYILQKKVFEFLEHTDTKYLKEYEIVYRSDLPSSKHIEKLINDWGLESKPFYPDKDKPNNWDRMLKIEDMVEYGKNGDAFLFVNPKEDDIGHEILVDHCSNEFGIYLKTCKTNLNYSIG